MKKQSFKGRIASRAKTLTAIALLFTLSSLRADAQIYYSTFADPSGKITLDKPSGLVCVFNDVDNGQRAADLDKTNYARVTGLVGVNLICSQSDFSVRAKIAFPTGVTESAAGSYAGFKIETNQVVGANLLGGVTLVTYKNDVAQETASGNSLLNVALLTAPSGPVTLLFKTTKSFDAVEVRLGTSLLTANVAFEHRFYYAFASATIALPVKLSSFGAETSGKNVLLNWTAATEYNVSHYEIEKSSNNGKEFFKIGSVTSKGTSSAETRYAFTDHSVGAGAFVYRLKMIDKDGSAEYSKIASVKAADVVSWKIYPTLLTSGNDITVETKSSGSVKTEIQIVNFHGQILQSVTTTGNKATLPTGKLSGGLYLVNCYQDGQLQSSEKIVVR